ncbi:hypothetical protein SEPCBS57363_003304 [Sporothrix epigloea]|uniref:GRF zinc finger domain containing protein n=1 Tax=Sporothrix epigloea TaxID=1892477 RepID=A0ABP0DKY4_9PEZI
MDAFVTREKKRKLVSPSTKTAGGDPYSDFACHSIVSGHETCDEGDESTEVKLAMLASLLNDETSAADLDQNMLLDLLLAHDGSVVAASDAFLSQPERWKNKKKLRGSECSGAVGQQTSLRGVFAGCSRDSSCLPEKKAGLASTLLSRRGRTLHLYDPVDVEAHTPCTLIRNFLPAEMANDLLREMLAEAKTFGAPFTFKLFDQVVTSPHTSCMYLESSEEANEAMAGRSAGTSSTSGEISNSRGARPSKEEEDGHVDAEKLDDIDAAPTTDTFVLTTKSHESYRYNGSRLHDIRTVTPHMARVKPFLEDAVNKAMQQRMATHYPGGRKLRYQNPKPWRSNAAFVNCYHGGQQSVGWHSDQLTYLGPRAVIGSMSLGVAREFRVRRIVPRDSAAKDGDDDAAGQISVHLPHNSLLIMHAEMQEEWKHCVTPAPSVQPHPIAGINRINITYRNYRADFHPNHTPRCRCGIATVLRVVQRKKENHGRYFWMCHAGNIPDREGCTFFQWAEFDDNGVPLWKNKNEEDKKPDIGLQQLPIDQ